MKERKLEYCAYAVLGGVFLILVWMNICHLDHWIDSDMAAEMIFSRLLVEEGRWIATPNWFYSTEFRVLYTQLFMQPLLYIFEDWYVVRVLTNLLTYVLLLGSYFYMVKPLGIRRHVMVLTATLLLLPFSETFATHVQMGNTYMPHMIIICFVAGMFFRLAAGNSGKKGISTARALLLCSYILLCVICGMSGVRYLLAIHAPLVVAAFIGIMKSEAWRQFRQAPVVGNAKLLLQGSRGRGLLYSLIGAVSAVAGYGLNVIFVASAFTFQTYEATNFISVYQGIFLERVQNTLGSLLMLFGYIPDKGFLSVRGLITLIAFVLLGGIVFVTVRSGKLLKVRAMDSGSSSDEGRSAEQTGRSEVLYLRRLLLWLFVSAFVLNTFVFVFTTSTIVPRYYLTVFLFVPALLAVYLEEEKLPLDRFLVCVGLCMCMLLATAKTVYSYASTDKNADKRAVAAFLQEEGYSFGYATYWNANIIQELTDGEVEVANLYKAEDLDEFHWSSPSRYYEDGYHTGKTFLLFTAEEAAECADSPAVREGDVVYEDGYYVVFHFDSPEEFALYQE